MRFASLKNKLPRVIPIFIAALLLLTLAVSGSAPSTKKTTSDQKTFGTSVQGEQENTQTDQSQPTNNSSGGNSTNDKESNSTKVSVSVNSNTTNGETTGSSSVAVTTNGQTQTFGDALDKCISGSDIKIKVDGSKLNCESDNGNLEIDWRSNTHQHTRSNSESSTDVNQSSSSR